MKNVIKNSVVAILMLTAGSSFSQNKIIDNPIPEKYRNLTETDSANIADIKWKDFFEESDLLLLLSEAVVKNNDLQVAEKNISIANLQYKQSKWGNVPQVNAVVTAASTRFSENSLNGINAALALNQNHIEDYSAGLQLSWEADIWGKIRNRRKSAQALYMQTSEAKKALQTSVVSNVAAGFYDLLMLDEQLEIARKTLQLNDSTLFIVKLQFDAGQVTSLAIQQTEAQRLVAAKLIPQLEQNIEIQENALSILTGNFPQTKERTSKLHSLEVKERRDAGIPAQLLSKRPDVKSAELALKVANANVGITKASLYPTLNITASGGVNSFEASNWFNLPASIFGSIAGGLTAPLLNNKRLRTNYEVSKIQRDQAAINFRQTVLIAVGEVSNALVQIEKLEIAYNLANDRVKILQQAIKNANMLFKNGMATYLEVIVAQSNLLSAELELASVKKDRLSANVSLYRALGGGWE